MKSRIASALGAAIVLVHLAAAAQTAPAADPAAAKRYVDVAAKLKAQGAFDLAAEELESAYAASPSADTLRQLLDCYAHDKKNVRVVQTVNRLFDNHQKDLKKGEADQLKKKLEDARSALGNADIKVSETGATLVIDDQNVGVSPLATPLDLDVGTHRLKVTKDGFEPFEASVAIAVKQSTPVTVTLEKTITGSLVAIHEKDNKPATVVVDDVERGPAPWTGDLPLGPHTATLKSAVLRTEPQKFVVQKKVPTDLTFVGIALTGHLAFQIADGGGGSILLDNKLVGSGSFVGDLEPGPHQLRIDRPGSLPWERVLNVNPGDSLVLQGSPIADRPAQSASAADAGPKSHGTYGGFRFFGLLQANDLGSQVDNGCNAIGSACQSSAPKGGGGLIIAGYAWNPLAVDFMFGGAGDGAVGHATDREGGRHTYAFARGGGVAAARLRGYWENDGFRISLAGGPGMAVRYAFVGSSGADYIAPAGVVDFNIGLRAGKSAAFQIGIMYWFEASGDSTTVARTESNVPFAAVSGVQHMFQPYLGFEFGL